MPSNESSTASNCKDHHDTDWTVETDRFAFTPRRLRVVCIGAGFSGLIMAHKLKHQRPLEYVDFTIYEKNHEVGGTWFENIYPGVGCDIPCQNIVFNTKLVGEFWNEEAGKWKLRLEQRDGFAIDDEVDILINGSGILNKWKFPDINGLNTFQGKLVHTACWDPEIKWEGKKVAVIGNGASALQVVPALQPKAAKLVNYIRHATWVSTNICGNLTRDGAGTNFEYTDQEKRLFQEDPEGFLQYRKEIEQSMMLSNSPENKSLFNLVDGVMRARLAANRNPKLLDRLIPKYEIGCRRLSPGDGYLEALQSENSRWCFDKIRQFTPRGILTDAEEEEEEEEFDLIVCATGFDTTFIPSWEMVGRNGRRLDEEWREKKPEAYFSVCAGGFPNYFMFTGPNCPVGHGSVPQMLDWTADYMLDWVEKMAVEDIKSIAVRDEVVRDYNRFAEENLKRCVWSKGCAAWYSKRKDGESNTVTAMYPGSSLHYRAYLKTIRGEHFDIRHNSSNPFRYLGNGELALERAEGADLAFYIQ